MTRRCVRTWLPSLRIHERCDFCDAPAVLHWRDEYPDKLLCATHLEDFPEAQQRYGTDRHFGPVSNTSAERAGA